MSEEELEDLAGQLVEGMTPEEAEGFWDTLGSIAKGAVSGAATGVLGGPVGALTGAAVGAGVSAVQQGFSSLFSPSRQAPTAKKPSPRSPPPAKKPRPHVVPRERVVPMARLGPRVRGQLAPRVLVGPVYRAAPMYRTAPVVQAAPVVQTALTQNQPSAAAQLLTLLGNPAVKQSLVATAVGHLGPRTVNQLPVAAILNAFQFLLAQTLAAADGLDAGDGSDDYLRDERGEYLADPANPEERAAVVLDVLRNARQAPAFEGEGTSSPMLEAELTREDD